MRVANNLGSIHNIRPYRFADKIFIAVSSMPIEQQLLLALQTSVLVGLSARLWWTGPYRKYPCFFSYLLLGLLRTAVMAPLPFCSRGYRNGWLPRPRRRASRFWWCWSCAR